MVSSLYFLGKEITIETDCFFITLKCFHFGWNGPSLANALGHHICDTVNDRKINDLRDIQVNYNLSSLSIYIALYLLKMMPIGCLQPNYDDSGFLLLERFSPVSRFSLMKGHFTIPTTLPCWWISINSPLLRQHSTRFNNEESFPPACGYQKSVNSRRYINKQSGPVPPTGRGY